MRNRIQQSQYVQYVPIIEYILSYFSHNWSSTQKSEYDNTVNIIASMTPDRPLPTGKFPYDKIGTNVVNNIFIQPSVKQMVTINGVASNFSVKGLEDLIVDILIDYSNPVYVNYSITYENKIIALGKAPFGYL